MTSPERQRRDALDRAFGAWIRERLAAQKPDRWTQQRLRDELAQRGYEVKREWLNQVIGGKHASDDLRRAIQSLLGDFADPDSTESTNTELAAAIREQSGAIAALVDELRSWRTEDRARLDQVEAWVDKLVEGALGGSGTQVEEGHRVLDGTAR